MGFSFDLESDPERPAADPEVRKIHAPRFSASVSRTRPAFDSEPEAELDEPGPDAVDAEEPPIDLPDARKAQALTENNPPEPRELLGAIRRALRAGAPPRPVSRGADLSATRELNRRISDPAPRRKPSERKYLGPLAAAAALGLTYLISTSSLVALGPRLARTSPRVPHLGSLGTKKESSDRASPSDSPSAAPPAQPGPPKAKEPLIERGPLPEGLSYPGKGLIEIVTSERELIYVDSIFLGRGPLRRVPVLPGEHAIKIRSGGTERDTTAVVRTAETTRVHFEADAHLVGADGKKADPEELD